VTFVLGVIVGACAMWLRDWVRAKPTSPLLQLPAEELRTMLAQASEGYRRAYQAQVTARAQNYLPSAESLAARAGELLHQMTELRDALRIVEAHESHEAPEPRGSYR
jgi:hypothetical protein